MEYYLQISLTYNGIVSTNVTYFNGINTKQLWLSYNNQSDINNQDIKKKKVCCNNQQKSVCVFNICVLYLCVPTTYLLTQLITNYCLNQKKNKMVQSSFVILLLTICGLARNVKTGVLSSKDQHKYKARTVG